MVYCTTTAALVFGIIIASGNSQELSFVPMEVTLNPNIEFREDFFNPIFSEIVLKIGYNFTDIRRRVLYECFGTQETQLIEDIPEMTSALNNFSVVASIIRDATKCPLDGEESKVSVLRKVNLKTRHRKIIEEPLRYLILKGHAYSPVNTSEIEELNNSLNTVGKLFVDTRKDVEDACKKYSDDLVLNQLSNLTSQLKDIEKCPNEGQPTNMKVRAALITELKTVGRNFSALGEELFGICSDHLQYAPYLGTRSAVEEVEKTINKISKMFNECASVA